MGVRLWFWLPSLLVNFCYYDKYLGKQLKMGKYLIFAHGFGGLGLMLTGSIGLSLQQGKLWRKWAHSRGSCLTHAARKLPQKEGTWAPVYLSRACPQWSSFSNQSPPPPVATLAEDQGFNTNQLAAICLWTIPSGTFGHSISSIKEVFLNSVVWVRLCYKPKMYPC